MKIVNIISISVAGLFLVSCFGTKEHALKVEPAPVAKPAVTTPNPRPDRPPPPPQPQDGSMIVKPGGTAPTSIPKVSEKEKNDAIAAAEREVVRRKENAAEADDLVSKALKNVDEGDIDKAFSELKKAVDKYPKTGAE